MKRIEIAADAQYGELVVVQEVEPLGTKRRLLCKCSCGGLPV